MLLRAEDADKLVQIQKEPVGPALGLRRHRLRSTAALLHGCCTTVRRTSDFLVSATRLSWKTTLYESGRCWARTSDLCRVKAALSR